jgi:hypothetical protein
MVNSVQKAVVPLLLGPLMIPGNPSSNEMNVVAKLNHAINMMIY